MSTASELLVEVGDISQGSPALPSEGSATFSNSEGAISTEGPAWFEKVADTELREFIANKGWKDPAEMAAGYRNLEKLVGGEKVPLPKGDADTEGWERVYKALGRPAKPEDYKLAACRTFAATKEGVLGLTRHGC